MKRMLALLLAVLLTLSLLSGCGKTAQTPADNADTAADTAADTQDAAPGEPSAAPSFQTIGDLLCCENSQYGCSDTLFVCACEADGVYYRATAELSPEQSEQIWALDVLDEDYEAQMRALVSPLPIAALENLSERIPAQETLDALAGRSGQELLDEGWSFWSWQTEEMEFGMYCGPFAYSVKMEGTLTDPENFDESQAGALRVRSVSFDGLGDATGEVLDSAMAADEAAFEEDGQNPLMNYVGEYQSGRAHATVEAQGMDGYLITIEWGDSALSLARWVLQGTLDTESMIAAYANCEKTYVTYDEDGEVASEELMSDECSGTLTFNDDWTFTWHDDQSEYGEDMVFDWAVVED